MLRRCCTRSRQGYRPLTEDGFGDLDSPVTVVVGKERKEFLVDPFVLEERPFRVLIETVRKDSVFYEITSRSREEKRVVLVDVDAILFEHMLWLMDNDSSSLFQLNLKEIIDFYAQDC